MLLIGELVLWLIVVFLGVNLNGEVCLIWFLVVGLLLRLSMKCLFLLKFGLLMVKVIEILCWFGVSGCGVVRWNSVLLWLLVW